MTAISGTTTARARRPTVALGAAAAFLNAAMAVSSVAGTLVAGDAAGTMLGGIPATAGIAGTAAGSVLIPRIAGRRGTRTALVLGYATALAGGLLATGTVLWTGAPLLGVTLGLLALGVGNAAAQLSRYVAAGLHRPGDRANAIALVVWIATIGAVGGPLLLGPATGAAGSEAGAFALAAGAALLAALTAATVRSPAVVPPLAPPVAIKAPAFRPLAGTAPGRALVAIATAQVVMVLVMTAAPMSMHLGGTHTTAIGAALSAHTFGMFALSPLTARLITRLGPAPVVSGGMVVLAATSLGFTLGPDAVHVLALFGLGWGWNLCFVAGSSVLAQGAAAEDRLALEGRVDAIVWGLAAVAGLSSTVLLGIHAAVLAAAAVAVLAAASLALRAGDRR